MPDSPFPAGMVDEWRAFLAADRTPPGLGVYDKVFETGLCFPLQRKRELAWMLGRAAKVGAVMCPRCDGIGRIIELKEGGTVRAVPAYPHYPQSSTWECAYCRGVGRFGGPRTVMEIGADKGGGLYHWCKLPTVRNVIACEIRGTPYSGEFTAAFPHRFFFGQASSTDPGWLKRLGMWLGKVETPIDVLFIDGDKTKMVEDFDAYLPLMNPNGVVFLHDVQDREPGRAFDELTARRRWRTEVFIDATEYEELERRVRLLGGECTAWQQWLLHWKGRSCGVGAVYLGEKP